MKQKACWLAKQYKKGWRLGLCLGEDAPLYLKVWFKSIEDIKKVLRLNAVFVHNADHRENG